MLDQEFADKLENAKEAFKINAKNGKIAVQKKTKKSAYKVKVTVNAAGNDHYKATSNPSAMSREDVSRIWPVKVNLAWVIFFLKENCKPSVIVSEPGF